jgi:hypothetical protein
MKTLREQRIRRQLSNLGCTEQITTISTALLLIIAAMQTLQHCNTERFYSYILGTYYLVHM